MITLTDEQRKAVTSSSRRVFVVAGAGTGKTRTLVARFIYLADGGVEPKNMVVITFTRKAADEMRGRIESSMDGRGDLDGCFIGTIHAYCLRMMNGDGYWKGYRERLGYRRDEPVKVYDEEDQKTLILQICRDLGVLKSNGAWKDGFSLERVLVYLECSRSGAPLSDRSWLRRSEATAKLIIGEYGARLKELNAIDYDGLLMAGCELMRIPDVASDLCGIIHQVLVDEFQDVNQAQYILIRGLEGDGGLFCVGDHRQSIYRFRGACMDFMLELMVESEVHHLTTCYRCSPAIVQASNILIEHNHHPHTPPLEAYRTGESERCHAHRGNDEAVISLVEELLATYPPGDIAVLARTNAVGQSICQAGGDRVPMQLAAGGSNDDVWPVDITLLADCLGLVADPRDLMCMMRLCNNLGLDRLINLIRTAAAGTTRTMLDAGMDFNEVFEVLATARDRGENTGTIVEAVAESLPGIVGWPVDGQRACGLVRAAQYWRGAGKMDPAAALRCHAMRELKEGKQLDPDRVTVSTIHGAKGLEWPAVVVAGAAETIMPSCRSITDEDLAEERRIAYVAFTRAIETLVVVAPYELTTFWCNKPYPAYPSRYIAEAGLSYHAEVQCDRTNLPF